eukprot:43420_1
MDDSFWGYIALGLSILLFGSFGVKIKNPRIVSLDVDPMVFQCYFSLTVGILSMSVLSFTDFVFSWWGVLGGTMWVAGQVMVFIVIHMIGYATGVAIWAGTTIIVGFIIGVTAFDQQLSSVPGTVAGVCVLLFGIAGAVVFPTFVAVFWAEPGSNSGYKPIRNNDRKSFNDHQLGNQIAGTASLTDPSEKQFESIFSSRFLLGVCLACLFGLINGSLQVPLHFYSNEMNLADDDPENIAYLVSFGLGALMSTPPLALLWFLARRRWPEFHVRHVLWPGVFTGTLWIMGYASATYATIFLGEAIGYPATQASLLVAGLWGVFYFNEIEGKLPITSFFGSGILIVAGVCMMSYFGR